MIYGDYSTLTKKVLHGGNRSKLQLKEVDEDSVNFTDKASILPGYRTDHSAISITLKLPQNKPGRGYWKFNTSLLKDKEYVNSVKHIIRENIERYSALPYDRIHILNIPPSDIYFTISDQLFLETLLMEIRGKSISCSAWKKKQATQQELRLSNRIQDLENQFNEDQNSFSAEATEELKNTKSELEELRKLKIQGSILRSKAKWIDQGEKPTQYFFSLEKQNYTSKLIPKLILEDGREVYKIDELSDQQKQFYESLYSEQAKNSSNIDDELQHLEAPRLDPDSSRDMEGLITYQELTETLKHTKNDKSPGLDGYPPEFFKFFWSDLGYFVFRSINESYSCGSMSISQKRGVVTCIPKANKSRFYLKKNWRPISLLSKVYKLASGCISNRIKQHLHKVINEDQKGFISGRFIGENLRLVYDILHETDINRIPGMCLLD